MDVDTHAHQLQLAVGIALPVGADEEPAAIGAVAAQAQFDIERQRRAVGDDTAHLGAQAANVFALDQPGPVAGVGLALRLVVAQQVQQLGRQFQPAAGAIPFPGAGVGGCQDAAVFILVVQALLEQLVLGQVHGDVRVTEQHAIFAVQRGQRDVRPE